MKVIELEVTIWGKVGIAYRWYINNVLGKSTYRDITEA